MQPFNVLKFKKHILFLTLISALQFFYHGIKDNHIRLCCLMAKVCLRACLRTSACVSDIHAKFESFQHRVRISLGYYE